VRRTEARGQAEQNVGEPGSGRTEGGSDPDAGRSLQGSLAAAGQEPPAVGVPHAVGSVSGREAFEQVVGVGVHRILLGGDPSVDRRGANPETRSVIAST
jgi:hypothetical protein